MTDNELEQLPFVSFILNATPETIRLLNGEVQTNLDKETFEQKVIRLNKTQQTFVDTLNLISKSITEELA